MTLSSKVIIFVVFMELPTWKGAYCSCCVNPLSVRLFNHACIATLSPGSILPEFGQTQYSYIYGENK